MMFNKVIFFHIQLKTHSWQHDEDIYDVVEKLLQKTLRHLMYFVVTSSSEKHFHFLCWDIKNSKKKSYLRYGNDIWNGIQQNIISISYTEMTQSKAANIQNQMEKVIQCQKTHQKVKIPQNLKNYYGKIKIL